MSGVHAKAAEARRRIWWLSKGRTGQAELHTAMPYSWIRTLRTALGISNQQLAARLGITPASVSALEASEARGAIRVETLRRAAEALGCDLTYAFIPSEKLAASASESTRREAGSLGGHAASDARWEELVKAHVDAGLGAGTGTSE